MGSKKVKLGTGLRRMAKFADEHPEAFPDGKLSITMSTFDTDQMIKWRDVMPERTRLYDSGSCVTFYQEFGPVHITVYFFRNEQNCAKVKTGTKIVKVPDPDYVSEAPLVEVEEDVYEWKCLDDEDDD